MTESTQTSPIKNSLTFMSRSAPYGQNKANLCLDMALASAVFEQEVCYVFMDDGVYQLLKAQDGSAIESKTLGNALETLSLYGIEKVYVDRGSAASRGITETDLLAGVQIVDSDAIADVIEQSDTVFNL